MCSLTELKTMIILIENEYPPHERNTADLMCKLVHAEFDKHVSEEDILNFYWIGDDYEKINRSVENENRF